MQADPVCIRKNPSAVLAEPVLYDMLPKNGMRRKRARSKQSGDQFLSISHNRLEKSVSL
jgi:hypothetical protein